MNNKKFKHNERVVDRNLEKEGFILYIVDMPERFGSIKGVCIQWDDGKKQDVAGWEFKYSHEDQMWILT